MLAKAIHARHVKVLLCRTCQTGVAMYHQDSGHVVYSGQTWSQ